MAISPRADGGSFKDPAGRVYRMARASGGERIVRGLNRSAGATVERLLDEPFFRELVAAGHAVETTLLDRGDPGALRVAEEGWCAAVEHTSVNFVTYPYEWPFSMLKDAALLQLHLLETGARKGWLLKDATPFNVQWNGTQPVFIDIASFVLWEEDDYWRGYRQFSATFLIPLLLTAHLGIPFQPPLRSCLEGIPSGEATKYFYGLRRFKRGVLSHVWFPARAENRARRSARPVRPRRRQPKTLLFALLDSLKRLVDGLSYGPARSDWSRYAGSHSYDDADMKKKKDFVQRHLSSCRPGLTWDLGANTGAFSRLAARHSRTVVAVDSDQDAVELLYRDLRANGPRNVTPLVLDLANLSPGQGWAGCERLAFDARGRPDMVLCLALVHHMRIAANIPLPLFIGWLRSLDAAVILEYVGRDDDMFQKLLENKTEKYEDYTEKNFHEEVHRCFSIRDRLTLKGGLRELLFLEPTDTEPAPTVSQSRDGSGRPTSQTPAG